MIKSKFGFIIILVALSAIVYYLYTKQTASCGLKDFFENKTEATKECRIALIKKAKPDSYRINQRLKSNYEKMLANKPLEEVLKDLDKIEIEFLYKMYPNINKDTK
ncbi:MULTISPECIES: hypothetical protein [unclassified Campylobacter]|uniref:hypothetical protein n=1 Tax=unclassified Campylobacter TaxID=2593542 RepID=UPI0022E99E20|nr:MULTISPECIES: hypothetical protein [unclassified Campylobacter]MDA3062893.1 hypothetical protein [Campylobacter sp. JMF_14 EL1]MDA3074048.1 hypothetical protein [Campylobacter sp. JMF_10 EL2]